MTTLTIIPNTGNPVLNTRIVEYVEGCLVKINEQFAKHYPNVTPKTLSVETGKRYVKILNCEDGRVTSVFGFIDMTNGDILKPATFKAPAKHARGNVYDADFGLSRTRWTGPEYLR